MIVTTYEAGGAGQNAHIMRRTCLSLIGPLNTLASFKISPSACNSMVQLPRSICNTSRVGLGTSTSPPYFITLIEIAYRVLRPQKWFTRGERDADYM